MFSVKKGSRAGWLKKLSPDEKSMHLIHTLGGRQRVSVISESGLYELVMRSDKKESKQFQDWVTREVLPSIRKAGTYTMPGAKKTIEAPHGQINI
ncbi:Bro-N domain-containing protein [Leisingera aquaemixtae]|uniref:BRO-N domain-containing protein n=1 Tax=Leisingera aquaemixtae TaxID=1396826 RepID=UPI003983FA2E